MANIKNFGIVGVGAGVQFGKGGSQLVQTSGTFAAMNATGNAFVRFQVADGADANDVASIQQLTNAVTLVNSNAATIQSEVDATQTGAGLNSDGSYAVPTGTSYLDNSASLANATILLDAAVAAEVARAEGVEAQLISDVGNVSSAASGLQAEVDQIETSVGLGTDGTLTLAAGNYLGSAVDLVSAVEILDSVLGNTNVALTSNAALISDIVANVASLSSDVANAEASVTALSDQLLLDEANIAATQATVSDLGNAVASNAAILSDTVANVATLQVNQLADEANIAALQESAGSDSAAIAALQSNVATLQGEVSTNTSDIGTLNGEVATNTADIGTLNGEVSAIQGSYVNKDGSVPMTGALDLGNNAIHNVSEPTSPQDAATKNYVDTSILSLSGAFEYKGTVVPGADTGNAFVMPVANAGAYYKALNDGYLIGAEANSVAFQVFQNDGVVHNTNDDGSDVGGTWDVIGHVEYTISGTAGEVTVVGSPDTGYTVGIDGAYTAERQAELADNIAAVTATLEGEIAANVAVLQGKIDAANAAVDVVNTAVNTETTRAEAAEDALTSALANTDSNVATLTATVAAVSADLANTDANVAILQASVGSEAANIAALQSNVSVLQDQATADEANIAALQTSVSALDGNVSVLQGQVSADEANIVALQGSVSDLQSNVATLDAEVAQNTSDISNNASLIFTVQGAAGLQNDGTYAANATAHYVNAAVSLHDADDMLDTAVYDLAQQLADLSQDTIKTSDSLNSVHVADGSVTTKLNVSNVATTVMTVLATANTNTQLSVDFSASNAVALLASGSGDDVDLRLAGQGAGHVIIGETGVGVIQSDAGYDMTVAAGAGANLNLLGDTVIIGEADGTPVTEFSGLAGATAYSTFTNGNTAVTLGAAGTSSNIDLVFAPKGTGAVNVSSAKVINVANATNSTDAVNLGQVQSLVAAAQTGIVTTVVGTLPATAGSVTLGTITGTVLSVRVLVSNAYDDGSTITVGTSMTANDLASATDIDESTPGVYAIDTVKDYTSQTITATVTNATGLNGAAKVVVEYLEA